MRCSTGQLLPAWKGCGRSLHAPATLARWSCSLRQITTMATPSTWATSRAIVANTSGDAAPPATSVAIRRSDASRVASTASCSRSACSARKRSSMSVKATTAPRPSGSSTGTET